MPDYGLSCTPGILLYHAPFPRLRKISDYGILTEDLRLVCHWPSVEVESQCQQQRHEQYCRRYGQRHPYKRTSVLMHMHVYIHTYILIRTGRIVIWIAIIFYLFFRYGQFAALLPFVRRLRYSALPMTMTRLLSQFVRCKMCPRCVSVRRLV